MYFSVGSFCVLVSRTLELITTGQSKENQKPGISVNINTFPNNVVVVVNIHCKGVPMVFHFLPKRRIVARHVTCIQLGISNAIAILRTNVIY
jgi:hypothetical protein